MSARSNLGLLFWLDGEKDLFVALEKYERHWVHQALVANDGITKAARALGISHQQLRHILDGRLSDLAYLAPPRYRPSKKK